jgi:O-antigen/teichoic acid export membrane protein
MLSQPLTNLVYGADYLATATVLKTLAIGFLITFPWVIVTNAVFAQNLQKKFLPQMLLGAIGNIVLCWFMIPAWGAAGAAVATVISQFVAYGWIFLVIRKRNGLTIGRHIYRMVIATGVMMAVIWLMQLYRVNFYATAGTAIAVYGLGLWLTQEPLLKHFGQVWQEADSVKN